MRQLMLAVGVVCLGCALAHWAAAQNGTMPGQVVGSSIAFQQVGSPFPQAGSKVGQPINMPQETAFMRRANPFDPLDAFRGTGLDTRSVVAPITNVNQNALERFYDKLKSTVGLASATPPPPPQNVTPGIFRRNRERAKERMWRRD